MADQLKDRTNTPLRPTARFTYGEQTLRIRAPKSGYTTKEGGRGDEARYENRLTSTLSVLLRPVPESRGYPKTVVSLPVLSLSFLGRPVRVHQVPEVLDGTLRVTEI